MSRYPHTPGSVPVDTSEEAADSMEAHASSLRAKVWRHIKDQAPAGATCDEVERALGLRHQTASARIRELVLFERLEPTGARRRTRSGRNARVYAAVGSPQHMDPADAASTAARIVREILDRERE